jgi:hypothetical protein
MSNNDNLGFLDILTIMSFCISLQNLELNTSQEDIQRQTEDLDKVLRENVEEIHKHLQKQDEKIDMILKEIRTNGS